MENIFERPFLSIPYLWSRSMLPDDLKNDLIFIKIYYSTLESFLDNYFSEIPLEFLDFDGKYHSFEVIPGTNIVMKIPFFQEKQEKIDELAEFIKKNNECDKTRVVKNKNAIIWDDDKAKRAKRAGLIAYNSAKRDKLRAARLAVGKVFFRLIRLLSILF